MNGDKDYFLKNWGVVLILIFINFFLVMVGLDEKIVKEKGY